MTVLRRHEDWELRLHAAIAERETMPFGYGKHDCCLAACALIQAQTGKDPAKGLRRYRSFAGAAKIVAEHGGMIGLANAVAEQLGANPVAPTFAQRGDAALVNAALPTGGEGQALGVVDPSGMFVLVPAPDAGWTRVPRKAAVIAWRIG